MVAETQVNIYTYWNLGRPGFFHAQVLEDIWDRHAVWVSAMEMIDVSVGLLPSVASSKDIIHMHFSRHMYNDCPATFPYGSWRLWSW